MEKKEEAEFAEYWKIRNQELQEAEQREVDEEKERAAELRKFHQMQADEKRIKAEKEFIKEQKAATKAQAMLDQQEKHFYTYAE